MSTTTAHLSDGRFVDVPDLEARAWAREAASLSTTDGLADWFLSEDENVEMIQGAAEDFPRCDHRPRSYRVVNASQASAYDRDRPHAASSVCESRACLLDALAWVERTTGEHGVWIDADDKVHVTPPAPLIASDTAGEAFAIVGDEFTAMWGSVGPEQIEILTNYAESLLGAPDTMT